MSRIPKKPKVSLTAHQFEVLRIVVIGNESADPTLVHADLDEILERVTRQTTKQSMQFTVRSLIINGMMVKTGREPRRGRKRVTFEPTLQGRQIAADRPALPAFVEPIPDDALVEFLAGE